MRPLALDDLDHLQTALDVLDERDLIAEVRPDLAAALTPAHAAVDRPVPRTGPLPPVPPSRARSTQQPRRPRHAAPEDDDVR